MRNLKKRSVFGAFIIVTLCFSFLPSCSNDDTDTEGDFDAPIINKVSRAEAGELESIAIGYANNMYIVEGFGFSSVEKIYFNDTDTYFNPTLVTNSAIFVTIDENTPYENASNELKIETKGGTVTYPFVVAPPAPKILRGFNPVNANEGDTMTIYGDFFLEPVVTIGTTNVPVVSNTLTKIVISTPADVNNKYITVTTISGSVTSTYAIGTAIYDDVYYGGFEWETWNNHTFVTNSDAGQGETYIKWEASSWGGFQSNWAYWNDQLSDYAGIRISVKGDKESELKFLFNGNWDGLAYIDITTEWKEYYFTWEELLNPTEVQWLGFQEFTGDDQGGTFYFDNIGYILK